jgi:hypothetical protein
VICHRKELAGKLMGRGRGRARKPKWATKRPSKIGSKGRKIARKSGPLFLANASEKS